MKKLFLSFLFLAFAFMAQAQDAKPTKQETIDFITNYIVKADPSLLSYVEAETKSYREEALFTISDFSINGSVLKFKYSRKIHYVNWASDIDRYEREYTKDCEIDIAKVDFLAWIPYKNADASEANCSGISFHLQGDGPTTFITSIVVIGQVNQDAQIYKAFNHLRKLCGAPEPIQF